MSVHLNASREMTGGTSLLGLSWTALVLAPKIGRITWRQQTRPAAAQERGWWLEAAGGGLLEPWDPSLPGLAWVLVPGSGQSVGLTGHTTAWARPTGCCSFLSSSGLLCQSRRYGWSAWVATWLTPHDGPQGPQNKGLRGRAGGVKTDEEKEYATTPLAIPRLLGQCGAAARAALILLGEKCFS